MEAQSFGDKHTVRKLETVQRYLQAYATALKFQSFELVYVDACAGSGSSVPKGSLELQMSNQAALEGLAHPVADTDEIIVGSAVRALGVTPPFHKYLLNDVKQSNVEALRRAVRDDFSHLSDRVELTRLDANEMLRNLCRSHNWKETRAVVFLDPFGLQIDYETLKLLGQTGAIDLWYLVPVFAMYRQVSGEGQINPDGGPRVDAALGTDAWRDVVAIEERSTDLFSQPQLRSKRAVDIAWFERVAKERLGEAFGGRVLDETLALGRNGIQEFSLMFAWANPGDRGKARCQAREGSFSVMAGTSEIEWTDVTWNPVAGCTIASSGCSNCYAMRMAARLQAMGHPKYIGTTRKSGERYIWTGRVNVDEFSLSAPLEWRKPKRIFVNSMSDLFHPDVPDEFIGQVWKVMAECPQHHFQVLTKRPGRMAGLFEANKIVALPNAWVGTSVESSDVADRVKQLVSIKDSTLFISFEPLIGKIDEIDLCGIHWAIVGGESGPRARPMEEAWVERLYAICRRDDVAFFFKQWGGRNKKRLAASYMAERMMNIR